jgi:hypothetical protein
VSNVIAMNRTLGCPTENGRNVVSCGLDSGDLAGRFCTVAAPECDRVTTPGGGRGALPAASFVRLMRHLQLACATRVTQLGTFHEEDVRPDSVDRSYAQAD